MCSGEGGRVFLVVVFGRFLVFVVLDLVEVVLLLVILVYFYLMCGDFYMCRCLGGIFVMVDLKIG